MTRAHWIVLVGVLLAAAPPALAQKSTELYIPIGKSPGLSETHTTIGRIKCVEPDDQTITVIWRGKTFKGQINDRTLFFLDRSSLRRSNTYGGIADCHQGLLCEIKYRGNRRVPGAEAQWIKIQVADRAGAMLGPLPAKPRRESPGRATQAITDGLPQPGAPRRLLDEQTLRTERIGVTQGLVEPGAIRRGVVGHDDRPVRLADVDAAHTQDNGRLGQ